EQLVVDVPDVLDLEFATGGGGGSLEAGQHPRQQIIESGPVLGAHIPGGAGVLGDHIGGVAPLGDDAVQLVGRVDVLAQGGDVDVGLDGGVEGVDSLLREGGGMGGLAPVVDVEVGDCDHPGVDHVG